MVISRNPKATRAAWRERGDGRNAGRRGRGEEGQKGAKERIVEGYRERARQRKGVKATKGAEEERPRT